MVVMSRGETVHLPDRENRSGPAQGKGPCRTHQKWVGTHPPEFEVYYFVYRHVFTTNVVPNVQRCSEVAI